MLGNSTTGQRRIDHLIAPVRPIGETGQVEIGSGQIGRFRPIAQSGRTMAGEAIFLIHRFAGGDRLGRGGEAVDQRHQVPAIQRVNRIAAFRPEGGHNPFLGIHVAVADPVVHDGRNGRSPVVGIIQSLRWPGQINRQFPITGPFRPMAVGAALQVDSLSGRRIRLRFGQSTILGDSNGGKNCY